MQQVIFCCHPLPFERLLLAYGINCPALCASAAFTVQSISSELGIARLFRASLFAESLCPARLFRHRIIYVRGTTPSPTVAHHHPFSRGVFLLCIIQYAANELLKSSRRRYVPATMLRSTHANADTMLHELLNMAM